jgi:prepilin-type N-terminal cleavage/methylation domain-containing protein
MEPISQRMVNMRRGFTLVEVMIVILILGIVSVIAVPNFLSARTSSQKNSCIANLHTIEAAKEQWAMDQSKAVTATPTQEDLVGTVTGGYIKYFPTCPAGGTYTIGNMTSRPTCTVTGHQLR